MYPNLRFAAVAAVVLAVAGIGAGLITRTGGTGSPLRAASDTLPTSLHAEWHPDGPTRLGRRRFVRTRGQSRRRRHRTSDRAPPGGADGGAADVPDPSDAGHFVAESSAYPVAGGNEVPEGITEECHVVGRDPRGPDIRARPLDRQSRAGTGWGSGGNRTRRTERGMTYRKTDGRALHVSNSSRRTNRSTFDSAFRASGT